MGAVCVLEGGRIVTLEMVRQLGGLMTASDTAFVPDPFIEQCVAQLDKDLDYILSCPPSALRQSLPRPREEHSHHVAAVLLEYVRACRERAALARTLSQRVATLEHGACLAKMADRLESCAVEMERWVSLFENELIRASQLLGTIDYLVGRNHAVCRSSDGNQRDLGLVKRRFQ